VVVDLPTRARVHAALGEPIRLHIVDALAHGDLTVNDLRDRTGVSSNLLAHHLDVLEGAGLIERRRSEGDGRRRYVVLDRSVMAEAGLVTRKAPHAPLFVCTHNSARSQFAAAWWRHRTGERTDSAGTEPADRVHPTAISVGADLGVDMRRATPHGYDAVEFEPDVVISVCDRAGETPIPFEVPHTHWSIPDPVLAATRDAFRSAFVEIAARIDVALGMDAP
jgi:ArsR family transcriptional regulator, arsenate/arsenite/antimonite-responsive transcriptional repressor / arsenate reductase (thioredoxin)